MRNTNFDWPICGHYQEIKYLQKIILTNNFAHAYLFTGPKAVGKFYLAKIFAETLLCHQNNQSAGAKKLPCGQCPSCLQCRKNVHPDLFVIRLASEKKNIPISDIKKLQHHLSASPLLSKLTIGLIDNADALSIEAANALLKTTEEPAPNTILILIAHSQNKLPKTLASRCSEIHFNLVTTKEIYDWLRLGGSEQETAENIAYLSSGRPGKAFNYLANQSLLLEFKKLREAWLKLITANPLGRIKLLKAILPNKQDRQANLKHVFILIEIWQSALRDIIHLKLATDRSNYLPDKKELIHLSKHWRLNQLRRALIGLVALKTTLAENINIRASLENYLLTI